MTEPELAAYVTDQIARRPQLKAFHLDAAKRRTIPTAKGFPDLVIAGPGGTLFRELKTEVSYPSSEQTAWLETLRAGGEDAGIWRPSDAPRLIEAQLDRIAAARQQAG